MQPAKPSTMGTELGDEQVPARPVHEGHHEPRERPPDDALPSEGEAGFVGEGRDRGQLSDLSAGKQPSPVAVVVLGASTGELAALCTILSGLRRDFPAPLVIAQRRWAGGRGRHLSVLRQIAALEVKEAQSGERIRAGLVYVAPPDVHVLVGPEGILSLSHGPPVHESRPSTLRLFSSASMSFGSRVVGVVLGQPREDDIEAAQSVSMAGGTVVIEHPPASGPRGEQLADLADMALPAWKVAPALARIAGQRRATQLWRVASPLIRRRRPSPEPPAQPRANR